MVNPIKVIKETVPQLAKIMESIHAHLELILEEDKKIKEQLILSNENLVKIIAELRAPKAKLAPQATGAAPLEK